MAYNTNRKSDMEAERELAKYLDKYLYTKKVFTRAERTDNATTQIDGSDIIVSIPSLNIQDAVVDEKASYKAPSTNDFRFCYSSTLAEKPINILLKKEVYIRLGEFHYFVKPIK